MVPDHTRGAHPTASGRLRTVVLFWQSYPALTNGGVVDAVVPCGLGGGACKRKSFGKSARTFQESPACAEP